MKLYAIEVVKEGSSIYCSGGLAVVWARDVREAFEHLQSRGLEVTEGEDDVIEIGLQPPAKVELVACVTVSE